MARFIITVSALFIACMAQAQNFPDAQKQPRQKEMRSRHHHYKRQAHRRHVRRGTAYFQFTDPVILQQPVCILVEDRKLPVAG